MQQNKLFRTLVTCFLFSISFSYIQAQVKFTMVDPSATHPSIKTVHAPHVMIYDSKVASKHKLILMIVGTGVHATDNRAMDSAFASWGYHVISIDYPNNVITTVCSPSEDSTCFDRYRREIITGAAVSEKVDVDSTNSLLNRFNWLLRYLVDNDRVGKWSEFFVNGSPVWSKIITAGHSQGAGHASYLGKMFPVNRVMMFSGPQDYLDSLQKPGAWLSGKTATPPSRFFAFLHVKDPFNVHHQLANNIKLMHLSAIDTTMVTPGVTVKGHAQILVNDIATDNPHGSTVSPQFVNVWQYMLGDKAKPSLQLKK